MRAITLGRPQLLAGSKAPRACFTKRRIAREREQCAMPNAGADTELNAAFELIDEHCHRKHTIYSEHILSDMEVTQLLR